jgi:hypothetical protein
MHEIFISVKSRPLTGDRTAHNKKIAQLRIEYLHKEYEFSVLDVKLENFLLSQNYLIELGNRIRCGESIMRRSPQKKYEQFILI